MLLLQILVFLGREGLQEVGGNLDLDLCAVGREWLGEEDKLELGPGFGLLLFVDFNFFFFYYIYIYIYIYFIIFFLFSEFKEYCCICNKI